jgi:type IV pilus assembly protein PilM
MIGLDIGTSAVRAVQLSTGRSGARIERLGQVLLPVGAVRDGEITDPDAVVDSIRALWSEWNFKGRTVALGVANQQVVVRQVDLPYLPERELKDSLSFQVQEYIPIPTDQAILDCSVLEHFEDSEGRRFSRVLVVAAQRLMIDAIIDVVTRAKLKPVLLDLDAFALLRSLAPDQAIRDGGGEMLLDIGASVTNVIVHEQGVPRFVRVLLMGGNQVTEGLMTSQGFSHEEAEEAKAGTGLPAPGAPVSPGEPARVVSERAGRFIDEIRGSLDYYTAQTDAVAVKRVVLAGGGSLLPNLTERLSAELRLPVEQGHPLEHLTRGRTGLDDQQLAEAEPFLAVAVGLAMGAAA